MLQGSLETFALPDVLVLLASTGKSGELKVHGRRAGSVPIRGRLWFEAGCIVGSDVLRATDPADAVFELLRLTEGTFSFGPGTGPDPRPPVEVAPVVADALNRLEEWRGIEQVVPAPSAWIELADEPPAEQLTLRADQWRVVTAVAGGRSVEGVLRRLHLSELAGLRAIKEMVEAGMVVVRTDAQLQSEADAVALLVTGAPHAPTPEPELPSLAAELESLVAAQSPAADHEPSPGAVASVASVGDLGGFAGLGALDGLDGLDGLDDLGEMPDLDALVTIPPRRRRRTEEVPPPASAPEPASDPVHGEVEEEGEAAVGEEASAPAESDDEPFNRGLLLKFLSSVRN